MKAAETATATFNVSQTVNVLNHIIFMAQENRSLDNYFGELRAYWKANGFADRSFDGLPQFNPTSGLAPLYGPPPTNPGCDPAYPPPNDCIEDSASPQVASYHLITQCTGEHQPVVERSSSGLGPAQSILPHRNSGWLSLDRRPRRPQHEPAVLRHQRHSRHGLLRRHRLELLLLHGLAVRNLRSLLFAGDDSHPT